MQVVKRSGRLEPVKFEKITARLRTLCNVLPPISAADVSRVAQHACAAVHDGILTTTLDQITADAAVALATEHPDYSILAARILVSNLQKNTHGPVARVYAELRHVVSSDVWDIVKTHGKTIDSWIDFGRDYAFDFFGFRTLQKAYLYPGERPQHMYMRVAIGIWGSNLEKAKETYDALSLHQFTHASPTLFNAGTRTPQLASCFLMGVHIDSLDNIFESFHKMATISKYGGGIGFHVHGIRAKGSLIKSTNGTSDGLVPMLKVANEIVNYVNQVLFSFFGNRLCDPSLTNLHATFSQSGKRKGSCAIYIEPHHADIMSFLDLKRNQGDEHLRARDLFYAMWISDLFMERVEADAEWSLFDPGTAPGLEDVYGDNYKALYAKYESEGRAVKVVKAHDVWFGILRLQVETGNPYMLYKDACNAKSNQKNLGTIKSSNLCSEIIQFTSNDEIAVCNLGSISLPAFVDGTEYDYAALHAATKTLARNLNRVIDVTFYPLEEARRSNLRHRPIGMGVQGLADVFFRLKVPFDSPEAAEINRKIFATIYHAGIETSCDLADEDGVYDSYEGSPASLGQLQFDLWGAEPHAMYDWASLKERVARGGIRNSLLVAPMPTASTAQVMGNTECFEPITSNLYSRTTLAGTFTVVNKYLLNDLLERGLWNQALKQKLVAAEGSVQNLDIIPADLKAIYKTAYEISMKTVLDLAADRGIYVDQSMSLNMFMAAPTFKKLSSMHFYAWRKGLKTGMYYLRSKAASGATKITVDTVTAGGGSPVECIACSG
jgi:ribonucleoside-diphosphate reductase alpha subunit